MRNSEPPIARNVNFVKFPGELIAWDDGVLRDKIREWDADQ
jgi:hypothetical protein